MLVQRAAKMHRRRGGGSLTLLLILPGRPATGILQRKPDVSKYRHLSPELKAKLEAVLQREGEASESASSSTGARTEVRHRTIHLLSKRCKVFARIGKRCQYHRGLCIAQCQMR